MAGAFERLPVWVQVIDPPAARVPVDTAMTELHAAVADLDPRLGPPSEQGLDFTGLGIVVNIHLLGRGGAAGATWSKPNG